jgi:uncharacterized repeat protein (TIGR01451 family)
MKTTNLLFILFSAFVLSAGTAQAQNGYIYTPISSSLVSFSGDGGHASVASFGYIYGLAKDDAGNIYVGDEQNYRIRKIDAVTGIVTTIAGTGTQGYTGDGGPATSADICGPFQNLCSDGANLYFFDLTNHVIRKIDLATNVITTIGGNGVASNIGNGGLATNAAIDAVSSMSVGNNTLFISCNSYHIIRKIDLATDTIRAVTGNGIAGYTGDGGLAINAKIGYVFGIAASPAGDLYIADNGHHVIRKIDAGSGIITTICGNGQSGMAIDGIPAITAQLNSPWDIEVDNNGNLIITDFGNGRIRKIDAVSGNIYNVAGFGTYIGNTSEAIPALTARVDPRYLCIDNYNNIYITESANSVRKITAQPPAIELASDSFAVQAHHQCNNVQFVATLSANYNVATYTVKTYFGNGTDATSSFVQRQQTEGSSVFDYSYPISGTYQVKHVLYNGSNAVDSIAYPLSYSLCRAVTANLFLDGNSDCSFDPNTEASLAQAATIAVDSNNVAVDTISVVGRFTYNTFGNIGDIYKFTVLNLPLGVQTSCLNGIFTDTIQNGVYTSSREIGTECGTGSAFDLSVNAWFSGTGNAADAHIVLQNTYCNPQNATFTMTYSPKYEYLSASPAPTSQSGNVLTWTLTPADFTNFMAFLHVSFQEANNQIVMPGDTVHTTFSITPTTGDIDPSNNNVSRVDTVTGPYDPNAVYVSPEGCITPGTTLQYTVTFENMGNDTAHNIYVMDTLNNHVDMQTLQVIASSHAMNFTKIASGAYNIVRFEFPAINLPDSSHHDLCHGMVVYSINSKGTMALTDVVENKAGIFFDYMPAVLTNVAESPVCQPQFVKPVTAANKLRIFPNPAYNELTVQGAGTISTCTVVDQAGRLILQAEAANGKATLNIKQLPAGMYFITVKTEAGNEVHKFVKM